MEHEHEHEHGCCCHEHEHHGHGHHHEHEHALWFLDERFLMGVAILGAILLGEYLEAAAVAAFYFIGTRLEEMAEGKSRKSIEKLMEIRPDSANLLKKPAVDADFETVDPATVEVGQYILVRKGEKVPLDGVIAAGSADFDTAAITGEADLRRIGEGDELYSGCVNMGEAVVVKVTKPFGESTVSKILELVEHAQDKKTGAERFITKFARIYTPIVVGLAVILALVPTLAFGADFHTWVYRALCFLVISCPCALVISVPLSFVGGIGASSRNGILVKGSNYFETLASVDTVAFDKTGTLTKTAAEGEARNQLKDDALEVVPALKKEGVKRVVMLSGDKKEIAEDIGAKVGLDRVYSELLPADKSALVEGLVEESSGAVAFVGDGINDSPALARADIGIAMGGLGSDAAIEAADVVIMTDEPSKAATAIRIARKTLAIAKENIVFAIGVKVLVMVLAALGIANMWLAVFADVGVTFIAVLNALRALRAK